MKGAHCLVCKEDGPDLVVQAAPMVEGLTGTMEFTCGQCRRRWLWRITAVRGEWKYVAVLPAPTRPGWGRES